MYVCVCAIICASMCVCVCAQQTSFGKFLAAFLSTSGAIFGTMEQYSPTSHKMEAFAMGTWMNDNYDTFNLSHANHVTLTETLSVNFATCTIRSLFCLGCKLMHHYIHHPYNSATLSIHHYNTLTLS